MNLIYARLIRFTDGRYSHQPSRRFTKLLDNKFLLHYWQGFSHCVIFLQSLRRLQFTIFDTKGLFNIYDKNIDVPLVRGRSIYRWFVSVP
jgi:hypothetical protein